jgi:hypothetical protein
MNTPFQLVLNELVSYWKAQQIILNNGLTTQQMQALEQVSQFNFEPDFKEYLSVANGFEDSGWDDNMFSFWSSDRILAELNNCHPEELICFADYCINLCSFGYQRGKEGIYIHYQHTEGLSLVANSLTEFICLYLINAADLLIDV